jgi:hypothetical protein
MHRFSPDSGGLLRQQCGSEAAPERTVVKGHGAPVYGRGSICGGEIERQKRIRSCGTLGYFFGYTLLQFRILFQIWFRVIFFSLLEDSQVECKYHNCETQQVAK